MLKFCGLQVFIYIVVLAVSGCAGRQEFKKTDIAEARMKLYLENKPEELKPGFRAMLEEGKRNYVLNNMRVGVDAFRLGHRDIAKRCFDNALNYIEAVFANNETAKKARSLWYEEGMKEFKGEPYERVMAYYYRGLLYMMDEDYENARSCFKAGIIQDAFAEENQHRCDFALLLFLQGYCSQKLGAYQLANAAFEEVRKLRPDFIIPPSDSNLLMIIETGTSPRKLADGIGHEELKFFRGRSIKVKRTALFLDDKKILSYPIEDIAWQAMTRGGRPVDKIIKGQVHFRKTHEKVSTTLTDISSNMLLTSQLSSQADAWSGVSAALGIFGVAEMALASRTRTHVDTRYWNNLPDTIHLACLHAEPRSYELKIEYLNTDDVKISEEVEKIKVPSGGRNNVIFLWKRPGTDSIRAEIK
jgi:tetratricopeptide (TPR) repeat protein